MTGSYYLLFSNRTELVLGEMKIFFSKLFFYSSLIYHSNFNSIYQVIEHQKSGGTWVARIIAKYLNIQFVTKPNRWLNANSLVRIHSPRQYAVNSKKQVYVIRDGRDVMTSFYFHLFLRLKIPQGKQFTCINDVKKNMPKYLEMYFNKQLGNKTTWVEHTNNWMRQKVTIVRYEDMLENTMRAMIPIVEKIGNKPADTERLENAVKLNDFKKVSGRNQGEENQESYHRKGIKGDYKNYFNRQAAGIFHYYAGKKLIDLGYEKDDSWVQAITDS
jgi:hypothetical protein